MTLHQTNAGATPSADIRRVVNRWLSPDHAIGQFLIAARIHLQLAAWIPRGAADRRLKSAVATIAPAFTMVALPRLRHLAGLAARVADEGVAGAIVECGTWRGGGLALVDWVLRDKKDSREVWGFDSFSGLPEPSVRDERGARAGFFTGWCRADETDVRRAFAALDGDPDRPHLVRGWLSATLHATETGPIALLNLDVDWYDSVAVALDVLFDRVVPGGYVNIDDFGRWRGCDDAVHDFLRARGLPLTLVQRTGHHGASLRKP